MVAITLIAQAVATSSVSIVYHLGVAVSAHPEDVMCGTKTVSTQLERLESRRKKMQCNGICRLRPAKNELNKLCLLSKRMKGVIMNGLGGGAT